MFPGFVAVVVVVVVVVVFLEPTSLQSDMTDFRAPNYDRLKLYVDAIACIALIKLKLWRVKRRNQYSAKTN